MRATAKNSRADAGKGTYTQFEPARTHTQLYNLNNEYESYHIAHELLVRITPVSNLALEPVSK